MFCVSWYLRRGSAYVLIRPFTATKRKNVHSFDILPNHYRYCSLRFPFSFQILPSNPFVLFFHDAPQNRRRYALFDVTPERRLLVARDDAHFGSRSCTVSNARAFGPRPFCSASISGAKAVGPHSQPHSGSRRVAGG